MKKTIKVAVAAALMTMGAAASAASVSHTTTIIDITHLTSSSSLGFAGFDVGLGTLTSVEYTFKNTISGTVRGENTSNKAQTVNLSSGAMLTLNIASLSPISVASVYSTTANLTAYDGTRDYGGTSGVTTPFGNQVVTTSSGLLTSSAALAAVTGGSVNASVSGVFLGQGSGNVSFRGNSIVNTEVTVTYNYTPAPVPEPETYAMLLAGLGLVGAVVAKRKAKKAA